MKSYRWILFVYLLATGSLLNAQSVVDKALQNMQVDVVYLASNLLEGRETGEAGEALAAEYIISRFQEIGLTPAGEEGGWRQDFSFVYNANPHGTGEGVDRTGRNVLGYLDNGAERTVIIGAHYDHLGYGAFNSLYTGPPAVHNGADDNASGVASLLYLAEALKDNAAASGHNYLFLAFSGEELGLVGSKYFVNNPLIDLEKVNYMLNMDMVGRLNEEKVLVITGAGTSPVWKEVIPAIDVAGIQPKTSDSGVGGSDHTSFYLKDLPVLHFFTGQHRDYHKPADDSELINYPGLLAVSNYILALIEQLDDRGELEFTPTKDEDENRRAARFKVTLGVMPDYVYQDQGMRIDAVIAGRPAEKAGIQDGDVVIQIGDLEVKDIYSYMEGLSNFTPGDQAKVKVIRDGEELEFEVEF